MTVCITFASKASTSFIVFISEAGTDGLNDGEIEGDGLTDELGDGERDGDGEIEGLSDSDGEILEEVDGLTLGDNEGERLRPKIIFQ